MTVVAFVSWSSLRIIFAVYLAILTPATCCCAIKGVLGRVTGIETVSCGGGCGGRSMAAMAIDTSSSPSSKSSCCANDPHASATTDSNVPQDSQKDCRCHEQSIDMQRPDAGAKLLAVAPQLELPPAFLAIPVQAELTLNQLRLITSWSRFERPPPPTLLAQRCLLII